MSVVSRPRVDPPLWGSNLTVLHGLTILLTATISPCSYSMHINCRTEFVRLVGIRPVWRAKD
ncbi:hypothetical protein GCM10027167_72050 [Nocardia heshunensis]